MEKGFDDKELADIMSEIESLEEEFSAAPSANDQEIPQSTDVHDDGPLNESEGVALEGATGDDQQSMSEEDVAAFMESELQKSESGVDQDAEMGHSQAMASEEETKTSHIDQNQDFTSSVHPDQDENLSKDNEEQEKVHHMKTTQSVVTADHDHDGHTAQSGTSVTSSITESSSMEFKVTGQMSLSLKFHVGETVVDIFVEKDGLRVETDSGATFTVPHHKVSKAS